MIWHNVTAAASRDDSSALEQCFWDLGAVSVTVVDGGDAPLYEPSPGETPLWQTVQVRGLFEDDVDLARVQDQLTEGKFTVVDCEQLADRQWEREWLKYFEPMQFGERLWVCPTGMQVTAEPSVVVNLDPGLAFGTGTHSTTRLCLEWLDSADVVNRRVLDFGCGSGILGVAASLLGAAGVVGIDNDPQALVSTRENAAKNEVMMTIGLPGEMPEGQYHIVIANILAQPLIELSAMLKNAMSRGGDLILSGIMESQQDWVLEAYGGLDLVEIRSHEGWLLLHLRGTS
ncbi:MAG TPA: 50S ribosomal protein L11 methyltransferase [Gammaproteobacteria bacterium]|nr:50S ribosomal protein L11 methyltransferase [Gammaproteobacteria bacterium]